MCLGESNMKSKKFLLYCFGPPPKEKSLLPHEQHICQFVNCLTHAMFGTNQNLYLPGLFCWKNTKEREIFDTCEDESRVCVVRQRGAGSGVHPGIRAAVGEASVPPEARLKDLAQGSTSSPVWQCGGEGPGEKNAEERVWWRVLLHHRVSTSTGTKKK